MNEWLSTYAPVISAFASLGTLLIWGVYLHIFMVSHQRQVKPMMLINRGEGDGLQSRCLVTNMSRDPIYIQSVLVRIMADGKEHRAYITDAEDIRQSGDATGWQRLTRQGPLPPGTMVDMGAYGGILDYAARACCKEKKFEGSKLAKDTSFIEFVILGVYGSEDLLIGASREFHIEERSDALKLRAVTAFTRQITRSRERKHLSAELQNQL
ncbi:hypothetical protein [Limoniibacter endophyticus]|uniref:Uncharacterized protein n=1 Tax=Limoniibacter endophyticus TaxID=1565040 RepID=A0A8J3DJR6_9HYPH|nr:hypothetical protein [Limoniibacter endophyticus]GHC75251.1 hypothetical protein GCM10010136_24840 [Limoniibacter endophyticus]